MLRASHTSRSHVRSDWTGQILTGLRLPHTPCSHVWWLRGLSANCWLWPGELAALACAPCSVTFTYELLVKRHGTVTAAALSVHVAGSACQESPRFAELFEWGPRLGHVVERPSTQGWHIGRVPLRFDIPTIVGDVVADWQTALAARRFVDADDWPLPGGSNGQRGRLDARSGFCSLVRPAGVTSRAALGEGFGHDLWAG